MGKKKKYDPFKDPRYNMPPHPSWVSKDGVWGYYVRKNGELEFIPEYNPSEEDKERDMKIFQELEDILKREKK